MPTVITIGSSVKDVFLIPEGYDVVKNKKFDTGEGMCFAKGGKFEVREIFYDTGGGATNAAATLRALGVTCGCYTRVGKDLSGDEIIADLKKRGVQTRTIITDPKLGTGYSTILLYPSGERSIMVYRGASAAFDARDLREDAMKAKWFYLTSAKGNLSFVKRVFAIAKKNKTKVFWNPGGAEIAKGITALRPLLRATEVLSVNREEAEVLTGSADLPHNLEELGKYVSIVLITDGKAGAYVRTEGVSYFVPSTGTAPLNTTGAGDAFGSGFLAAYITTQDWQMAVKVGTLNADGVVSQMGAKHGLLSKMPSAQRLRQLTIKKL